MNAMKLNNQARRSAVRRTALAVAIAAGVGLSGQVLAQATTTTIFGSAPVAAGETVQVVGGSGFDRTVPVDSNGRYSVTVPVGTYTVNLVQNGTVVQSQANVTPKVSGAQQINFTGANAKSAQTLSTVTVTGNALPAIDVTSTREATVITAEQLQHLPLARSGAAIALLAPGTVEGAGMLGGGPTGQPLISFGGSSVAENAYYINGFNTSDPLGNAGGITLPYGSIAQQETLTSGYDAEYGRSAGGVISQIGKSGTNDWHFGAQALWAPAFARANYINYHYVNPLETATPSQVPGSIYQYRNRNTNWENIYDAYISGPLIKDKLFFFLSAESDKQQTTVVQPITAGKIYYRKYSMPKFYGKLDWNINDSNTLSVTGVKNQEAYSASISNYNYAPNNQYAKNYIGSFSGLDQSTKNAFGIWIAKYTSYITDNITFDALYGKMSGTYYTQQPMFAGFDPTVTNIIGAGSANPALWPNGQPPQNGNVNTTLNLPNHKSSTTNLRLDLDWKLGQHDIKFGIDNMTTMDVNAGNLMTGPGFAWDYAQSPNPAGPTIGGAVGSAPFVDATGNYANGAAGYYVSKYVFLTDATVKVAQRAQYIQDNWQVLPNLLLNLGLRSDQFTNYNPFGVPYMRLTKPQWAPRVGFSWDVFGDSTLKVFGNAGRYYLAMPAGVALRESSPSTYVQSYYTYGAINPDGTPVLSTLVPILSHGETIGNGVPVSLNNEYGQPLDPSTVHSTNLKAEYQNEFVLGMQQQINSSWVYGVQGTYRSIGRIVDDVGDTASICKQVLAQNPNLPNTGNALSSPGLPQANCGDDIYINPSVLINPGSSNQFKVTNYATGGYNYATVTPGQFGFPAATRKYYALEAFLEHPWDGKWSGKVDYVFSKSYGSTEGPVQSDIGQGGNSVSATTQWDYGQIMQYANGEQANSRRHVLKAYGTYQVAPEWTVSGILTIASGTPKMCLGYYGPSQSNPSLGYGSYYHWCGGVPAPGGSTGHTPWIHPLNLSVEYRPEWAGKKLGFQLQVHNVFNEQKMTQAQAQYGSTLAPTLINAQYGQPFSTEAPRYMTLGVTYDW